MPAPRKRNSSQRSRSSAQPSPRPSPRTAASSSTPVPELVDPRWLLRALGIVFAVALLLSWGALCLLWYQGQWQLVLHPSRTVAATPASLGLNFTDVTFADDVTGTPQLHGWLIPSGNSIAATALLLHGGDGSMSDALARARALHNAGVSVLLFDYRGYGQSSGQHPSQLSMQQDAESALNFLTSTQHIPTADIVLYGQGVGASLALQVAEQHPDIPAIILDAPDGDLTDRVVRDSHSSLVPARLLFHEDFPLDEPLRTLSVPKLLITYTYAIHPPVKLANAAGPKVTLELPSPKDPAFVPALQSFIAGYVYSAGPLRVHRGRWQ